MISKRDISMARTTSDMERRYQLGKIPNKVDKTAGKGLSTNDFTNAYKENVDNNTKARHTHNNVSLLNSLKEANVDRWNKATTDTIYTLFDGVSIDNIELENIDYDFFVIVYGNDNYIDSKIIYYTDKLFCLSLTTENETFKEFYTFSEKNIQKTSTTENISIFKVIAYKKGVDI